MGSEEFKLSEKIRFVKIRPSVFQAFTEGAGSCLYFFDASLYLSK